MRIRIPPKRIREKFLILYELNGAKKAVNYLSDYYGVRRIKIVLDGRRVPKGYDGLYFNKKAYFTRRGLRRRIVLHEFYHHFAQEKGLELPLSVEERQAYKYASEFLRKCAFQGQN